MVNSNKMLRHVCNRALIPNYIQPCCLRLISISSARPIRGHSAGSVSENQSNENEIHQKLLKVAIIGMPNAGKSTLINNLLDRRVCPASSKVHTTRNRSLAIFTEEDSQIVFLDTPGIVNVEERNRFNLERSFLKDSKMSLKEADAVGIIHDVSNSWTKDRIDIKVIKLLEKNKEKLSFLVMNKVDMLKSKRKLLDLTRQLTDNCIDGKPIANSKQMKGVDENIQGWPYFDRIFMVSSLTGSGVSDVKDYLVTKAKPGKWMFPSHVWTDQTAETLIVNTVQAKLLDYLPQEIPYELRTYMEYFNINEKGIIKTVVLVKCPTERKARLVCGLGDGKIRQITESVQSDLQEAFQNYVRIKIVVEGPEKIKQLVQYFCFLCKISNSKLVYKISSYISI